MTTPSISSTSRARWASTSNSSWQRWVLDQGDLIKVFNNIYAYYMYGFYACAILLLVLTRQIPLSAKGVHHLHGRGIAVVCDLSAGPASIHGTLWLAIRGHACCVRTQLLSATAASSPRTSSRQCRACIADGRWSAGIMVAPALPWRGSDGSIGVFLILLLPVTVIVTGNHYWLDVVGGWMVVGLSLLINRALPFPLPIRWPWQRDSEPDPVRITSNLR